MQLFFDYDKQEMPDIDSMKRQMETHPIKLICVENTHNFRGGAMHGSAAAEKNQRSGR